MTIKKMIAPAVCCAAMLLACTHAQAQAELELDGQAANNTRDFAQAIGPGSFVVNASANVFGSLPTAMISGRASANDVDFYAFSAPAGIAYFDIDGAASTGQGFDSYLALFDASGTLLADNDDAFPADPGSASDRDAFIGTINLAGGQYFIAVASVPNFASATFTGGVPTELFRPDGGFGGFAFDGATTGDASFAFSGPQVASLPYTLSVTIVPAPGALALALVAPVALRRRR